MRLDPVVRPGCVYAWICTSSTAEGLARDRSPILASSGDARVPHGSLRGGRAQRPAGDLHTSKVRVWSSLPQAMRSPSVVWSLIGMAAGRPK